MSCNGRFTSEQQPPYYFNLLIIYPESFELFTVLIYGGSQGPLIKSPVQTVLLLLITINEGVTLGPGDTL